MKYQHIRKYYNAFFTAKSTIYHLEITVIRRCITPPPNYNTLNINQLSYMSFICER